MTIDWDAAYASGRDYRPMNQLFLDRILAQGIKASGPVLDIGCGSGDLAVKLAQRGYQVTGIDLSGVAVEQAQQRAAKAGVVDKVSFSALDIMDATQAQQLAGEKYDLVTCNRVLAFVQDKATFLGKIKDYLAPDGRCVLITPVLHPGIEYPQYLRDISVDDGTLTTLLSAAFKKVIEIDREYFDEWGDRRTVMLG